MEKFVNDLLKSPCDLSSLTHRIIRKKYLVHTDQEGCSDRERAKLKAIVEDRMVKKVTDQSKRADSLKVKQNVSKVAVTHGKQREKDKNKGTRRNMETSECDKESERPLKTHPPTSACEDSAGNVGEPSHDSSDFEVCSPVTKTIRKSSKRRLSLSEDSDSGSDSEQETVQMVEKKKSLDSLQRKTKKRRTVKPPTSDSDASDGGNVGGKRQKHGSGDGNSESRQFGNSRSKARRNGNKKKNKKKKRAVSDSDSDNIERNASDSGDGGAETIKDSRRKRHVSDSDSTCNHLTGDDDAVSKISVNRTDKSASKGLNLMDSDTESETEMDKKQITATKSHGKKPHSNIASGKSNHSQKLNSGDSSDGVAEPGISENLRKKGDIFDSESMCSNLTSDDDSVKKKGKSVKRSDKKKKTKKGPSLMDSATDQRVEKHQKISPEGRKPKSSVTTGKSNRKQNQKQDAERKSKNRVRSSSDESDNASEYSTSKSEVTHREVGRERKHTAQRETKRSSVKGRVVASSSDEELPLSKATWRESQSSDSSDTDKSSSDANHDGASNTDKRTETKVTTKDAKGAKTSRVSGRVRNLKAILRACNLMPVGRMHTVVFGECRNDRDVVRKLKSLLADAGMSDPPTMKKAKEIRLKKELSELDGGNIISSKGRSVRRCRDTSIDYGAPVAEPVKRLVMPACGAFKNLSRLVDSEGSDSSP